MDFLKDATLIQSRQTYQLGNKCYEVTKRLCRATNIQCDSIIELENGTQLTVTKVPRRAYDYIEVELKNKNQKLTKAWRYSDTVCLVHCEEV